MNLWSLLLGALTLRTETFLYLRERSDVFWRGFLVMLMVALVSGAVAATTTLITRGTNVQTEEQFVNQAVRGFENSYRGSAGEELLGAYIREGAAMVYEISHLPPRAGEASRPLADALRWLGETLAEPFTSGFMGFLLIAGLLAHLASRWLGGRASLAQMLGLTALAYAPDFLRGAMSAVEYGVNASGSAGLGALRSLILLVIILWETVIYIKATAVAQQFSIARAFGAILIAIGLLIVAAALLAIVIGLSFGGLVALFVARAR